MRTGFYFSFDALIALSILGITTVLLLGATSPLQSASEGTIESFRQTNVLAEDSAQMAARSSLSQALPRNDVEKYIADTALDTGDRSKSVLDVIAILWASNETAAARNLSLAFFGDIISGQYGYRISVLDGDRSVLYNTTEIPKTVNSLANARRIVSGVQKNRPQQGYLSRARATQVDKNTTEVFGIPMAGSAVRAGDDRSLDLTRKFHVDAEEIQNATLYLSMETGGSDPNSISVEVNGQDAGFPNTWDYEVDKDGNHLLFHKEQVTGLIDQGWNSVFISAKNTGGGNSVDSSVHINPGSRMEVTYSSNETANITARFKDRTYFTNVETSGHQSRNHGAWSVMSYYVPTGADVTDVTLNVHGRDVDLTDQGEEFQLYLNDEKVNGTEFCTSGCTGEKDFQFRFNLTNQTRTGTNVVTVYLNTFLNSDGSISGFGDDDHIELFSDPAVSGANSSYLQYEYERARSNLVFGKIELARTERFGGTRSNPKTFNTTFEQDVSLLSTFVHLAQLDSQNVTVTAEDGEQTTVFRSPRDFSTPTDIFIQPDAYNLSNGTTNTVTVSDECTDKCDILPESTFERRLLIRSQVPYGDTFQNRSAADNDAKERLNETLGDFVDATEITSSTLSVNDVPWLFGPVTFEVEVWQK